MKKPGSKLYTIEYIAQAVADIKMLPKTAKEMIREAIENRLMVDPISFGKPLRYSLKGYRRLRIADYRVVYRIDQQQLLVIIVAIKHRKDIYES